MYIKRLAEKFVHKALLVFEILSFEFHRKESTNVSNRSLLTEQNQNVLIWSAYYRKKTERFNLFQNYLKSNRNVLASSETKPERNQANFLSDRKFSINLCFKGNKTELL